MKWADYCISKINYDANRRIAEVIVHVDNGETVGAEMVKNRIWLIQQFHAGRTFCCISKNNQGRWVNKGAFTLGADGRLKPSITLPTNSVHHKTFVSYYHRDDQDYRTKFENLFGDLFVNKCVQDGDIDSDNSAEYIKQLIHQDYMGDTTVLVVLVGPNTKHRKHIDWEISGALDYRVGDKYTGLIGILLPTHPDYGKEKYSYANLPKRLAENAKTGYATIYDWTEDRAQMQKWIQAVYNKRTNDAEKITNRTVPQMQRNTNS